MEYFPSRNIYITLYTFTKVHISIKKNTKISLKRTEYNFKTVKYVLKLKKLRITQNKNCETHFVLSQHT